MGVSWKQRDGLPIEGFYKSADLMLKTIDSQQNIGIYKDFMVYPLLQWIWFKKYNLVAPI